MDELKIEQCLFSKWNRSISIPKAQEEIRQLLSRRKPLRLFHDLRQELKKGGNRKVPHDVFVITCALFCRGQDTDEEIISVIQKFHMEQMLFVGFRLFLCNMSKKYHFTIRWSDNDYPNRHAWLSRFLGQFHYAEYRELFSVAQLLYKFNPYEFWQIAKADPNDLLLLNWFDTFWEFPSTDSVLELLNSTQSERRQALAFWWLTFPIQQSAEVERRAVDILSELKEVPDTILVPRVYEFILSEQKCPRSFYSYLVEPSRDSLLRQEMKKNGKIADWNVAIAVANLINQVKDKRRGEHFWNILLSNIEKKLKSGFFYYGIDKSWEFLRLLPDQQLKQFQQNLTSWMETLHTAEIDSIVRPQVYQHDVMRRETIQKIFACLE